MAGETDALRQDLANRRAATADGTPVAAEIDELIARLETAQRAYDEPPAMPSDRQRLIAAINRATDYLKR